jgi:hypothetical protein
LAASSGKKMLGENIDFEDWQRIDRVDTPVAVM